MLRSIQQDLAFNFGFEVRRYDYLLTKDGREVVADIKKRKASQEKSIAELVKRIREANDPDYFELSIAAKSYFLLKKHDKPMTESELRREAEKLGWNLSPDSIERALSLLERLQLVS